MGSIAVVDVGSNSGRIVVLRVAPGEHLEAVADARAPLRLAVDLRRHGRLSEGSIARTVAVLRDFRALADGAGADRVLAVATSAVREAPNRDDLVEAIRQEAGIDLEVIDGDREALLSFRGAVNGLPVEDGVMMDIGGGSLELTRFHARRPVGALTLPLGSLRVSDGFLASDPPTQGEIAALVAHVRSTIDDAGIEPLGPDEHMIATGGTVRNLAKMDRHTRTYPIPRLHGYVLTLRRLEDLVRLLASRRASRRRRLPGLNPDRADSMVGGAVVTLSAMDTEGASELLVAGQGLREGVALEALGHDPPSVEEARRVSVRAMAERFTTWEPERVARRWRIVLRLLDAAWPDAGPEIGERLEQAAILLDLGRSIDFYRRFDHTADVILAGDLAGFTHRKLALLSAVIRAAGDGEARVALYRPLLTTQDKVPVARAAVLLSLADAIEQRIARGAPADVRASTPAARSSWRHRCSTRGGATRWPKRSDARSVAACR